MSYGGTKIREEHVSVTLKVEFVGILVSQGPNKLALYTTQRCNMEISKLWKHLVHTSRVCTGTNFDLSLVPNKLSLIWRCLYNHGDAHKGSFDCTIRGQ